MKIAYNWLKDHLNINLNPEVISDLLTDCGLEVEGLEEVETIKGGLKGLVIGQVVSVARHANADKLSCTIVNVGGDKNLPIVCGAPNVAEGQKVVVALVGAKIYPTEGEPFEIKKAKIRGEVSEGMICAEDEIGLGENHDGIMVLPDDAIVGTHAADFFNVKSDYIFEIGLTPNRADAMSHFGVARDLLAVLKQKGLVEVNTKLIDKITDFKVDNQDFNIPVVVENQEACPRYCGVTITNVKIAESPEWLKNKLRSIGLKPLNNVVDITNYILHDLGQPLHAFDADEIAGNSVFVKTLPSNSPFVTLDEVERKLNQNDLMICNQEGGMCIAGVFGGLKSGVKKSTKNIFLESAYFNPVFVRKTAKRHGLNTDASFRFERGIDPNITMIALQKAAMLIKEVAGGEIASTPKDTHPENFENFEVSINISRVNALIGKNIEKPIIKDILNSLDIEIIDQIEQNWLLSIPPYRVDVKREADVVEEILRIYGYNEVEIPQKINASVSFTQGLDFQKLKSSIADNLIGLGFNEAMSNSLISSENIAKAKIVDENLLVKPENPLSAELDALRPNLLVNALEAVRYNLNRKQENIKLFEIGKGYILNEEKYSETRYVSITVSGNAMSGNWKDNPQPADFYFAKGVLDGIVARFGLNQHSKFKVLENTDYACKYGVDYNWRKNNFAFCGELNQNLLQEFDIKSPVFYAQINLDLLFDLVKNQKVSVSELPKFPAVKRDLALLVNKEITFDALKISAQNSDQKFLKSVDLFDVYEGKNLPEGKKSYGLTFILQDQEKTLTDKEVERVMDKIYTSFKANFAAELR